MTTTSPRALKALKATRAKPEPPRLTPVVLGSGASEALKTARLAPCAAAGDGASSSAAAAAATAHSARRRAERAMVAGVRPM